MTYMVTMVISACEMLDTTSDLDDGFVQGVQQHNNSDNMSFGWLAYGLMSFRSRKVAMS